MLKTCLSAVLVLLGCTLPLQRSIAGPLLSAEVTKIINRVAVIDPVRGEHPAVVREVIKDDLGLQTGEKSRSELLFQDSTLTRIGAETFFSFKTGTRDMTLEKGSMLLQVPKGLGGAKIKTAAVTAAITGTTIMMEYIPGKYIKVLVLEGSLRLSRNGTFGDSLVLRPGKMVIMRPDAKRIPDPIDVDLEQIVKTSTLVNFPDAAPLPSIELIQAAIDTQNKSVAKGDLVPTNLVMGHGTDVILASDDQLAKIAALTPADVNGNGSAQVRSQNDQNTETGGTLLASATPLPPIADPVNESPTASPLLVPITESVLPVPSPEFVTDTVASSVASVTDSTTSLVQALPNDAASVLGSLTGSATSLVGPVAGDTSALLGSLTAPVVPLLGTATDSTTSLVASLTTTTASLPLIGSVTDSAAALLSSVAANTTALPSPDSVTDTISSLTSSTPSVATITETTTSILGSVVTLAADTGATAQILSSVTGSTGSLPVVGTLTEASGPLPSSNPVIDTTVSALSVLGSVTNSTASLPIVETPNPSTPVNTISSLVTSPTNVTATTNTLLSATLTTTSPMVSVASSTELLAIVNNTAPSTGGGTLAISPTTLTAATPVSTSTPAPVSSSTTTSSTVASSSPSTTLTSPTSTTSLTALTSVPTNLVTSTTSITGTTKTTLPLFGR